MSETAHTAHTRASRTRLHKTILPVPAHRPHICEVSRALLLATARAAQAPASRRVHFVQASLHGEQMSIDILAGAIVPLHGNVRVVLSLAQRLQLFDERLDGVTQRVPCALETLRQGFVAHLLTSEVVFEAGELGQLALLFRHWSSGRARARGGVAAATASG